MRRGRDGAVGRAEGRGGSGGGGRAECAQALGRRRGRRARAGAGTRGAGRGGARGGHAAQGGRPGRRGPVVCCRQGRVCWCVGQHGRVDRDGGRGDSAVRRIEVEGGGGCAATKQRGGPGVSSVPARVLQSYAEPRTHGRSGAQVLVRGGTTTRCRLEAPRSRCDDHQGSVSERPCNFSCNGSRRSLSLSLSCTRSSRSTAPPAASKTRRHGEPERRCTARFVAARRSSFFCAHTTYRRL